MLFSICSGSHRSYFCTADERSGIIHVHSLSGEKNCPIAIHIHIQVTRAFSIMQSFLLVFQPRTTSYIITKVLITINGTAAQVQSQLNTLTRHLLFPIYLPPLLFQIKSIVLIRPICLAFTHFSSKSSHWRSG